MPGCSGSPTGRTPHERSPRPLPAVGGDVEAAARRGDRARPRADLRVPGDVLDDAPVAADEGAGLLERGHRAGEREVGAHAPLVLLAPDAQLQEAFEHLDRERPDRRVHAVAPELA